MSEAAAAIKASGATSGRVHLSQWFRISSQYPTTRPAMRKTDRNRSRAKTTLVTAQVFWRNVDFIVVSPKELSSQLLVPLWTQHRVSRYQRPRAPPSRPGASRD